MFKFSNTYINLGEQFFQKVLPEKVTSPQLLLWNEALATQLSVAGDKHYDPIGDKSLLAQLFSGNQLPPGAESIALAYSGHQFGHFNPQLGDGRAHLLGEVIDQEGMRRDIQLKGSGRTVFSRRGDGKCALGPALREYIMSEAMFALGVPTSRCLAVVTTGEFINRGGAKAGAVVTRVASSHIRVGTFQYFAARRDLSSLKSLVDYTIERHFAEINSMKVNDKMLSDEQRLIAFLDHVMTKQITLIIEWLRVGFIHGVMNTDNTAICGETIDFGPCAMMGQFDEQAVFSSIDENGRYAFGNQGNMAQWNMARLADCLLPLLIDYLTGVDNKDRGEEAIQQQALTKIESLIHQYSDKFTLAYYAMYVKKLGLVDVNEKSRALVDELLTMMQNRVLDYTQTFRRLTLSLADTSLAEALRAELGDWYKTWLSILESRYLSAEPAYAQAAQALMAKNNPVVIPRNHHVENVLTRCEDIIADVQLESSAAESIHGIVEAFLKVLRSPYDELATTKNYQDTPADGDRYYQTFCGT